MDSIIPVSDDLLDEDLGEESLAPKMSLGDHLEELRARIILSLLVFGAVLIFCIISYKEIMGILLAPLRQAVVLVGKPMHELVMLQAHGPTEKLMLIFSICILSTLILTLPFLVYQLWCFVAPGLTEQEGRAVRSIFLFGALLFILGVVVAHHYVVPLGLQWIIEFNQNLSEIQDRWRIQQYLSFLRMFLLGFGLAFETPLVMMALARVRLITPEGIRRVWRPAILAMLVVGALLTPPDPVTQVILAILLMGMYGIGYLLAVAVTRKMVAPE